MQAQSEPDGGGRDQPPQDPAGQDHQHRIRIPAGGPPPSRENRAGGCRTRPRNACGIRAPIASKLRRYRRRPSRGRAFGADLAMALDCVRRSPAPAPSPSSTSAIGAASAARSARAREVTPDRDEPACAGAAGRLPRCSLPSRCSPPPPSAAGGPTRPGLLKLPAERDTPVPNPPQTVEDEDFMPEEEGANARPARRGRLSSATGSLCFRPTIRRWSTRRPTPPPR